MGPHLRHEAVGKQYLLVAGQTRQMHVSTKDPKPHQRHDPLTTVHTSGPLQAPPNQPDVGWVGDFVEAHDSGMNRV